MKEKKIMESMPVARRTRKQTELREKELIEKHKRARLAARNEYWKRKRNAANFSSHSLGGDDDDEEDVIVIDEFEYLKHCTCMVGEKESSRNVDVSFEKSSDDSIQIVGERWNPLGAGLDNDEDGDFQPSPFKASGGGASDSHSSSPFQSSENDDDVSDEDFLVNEAEMGAVYSSESSQYYSGYASEKEGKWKGKTSAKNSKSGAAKKQGRPRKNPCEKIRSESKSENEPIRVFAKSENGGNRKPRGTPPKGMNVRVGSEPKNGRVFGKRGTPPKNCNKGCDSDFLREVTREAEEGQRCPGRLVYDMMPNSVCRVSWQGSTSVV